MQIPCKITCGEATTLNLLHLNQGEVAWSLCCISTLTAIKCSRKESLAVAPAHCECLLLSRVQHLFSAAQSGALCGDVLILRYIDICLSLQLLPSSAARGE